MKMWISGDGCLMRSTPKVDRCIVPNCAFSKHAKLRRAYCPRHYSIWKRLPSDRCSLDEVITESNRINDIHRLNSILNMQDAISRLAILSYPIDPVKRIMERNEMRRISHKRWYQNNKGVAFALVHKRRAQKLLAAGSFTESEITGLEIKQRFKCNMCGCCIANSFHRDHIIPPVQRRNKLYN